MIQLRGTQATGAVFFFYTGLQLMGCGPPISRRAICFTQLTNADVNLIPKHSQQTLPDLCLTKYLSTLGPTHADLK